MSQVPVIDQVKHVLRSNLSKFYKELKGNISKDEWKEFESLFWKIRPLIEVDYSKYSNSIRVYDPDPVEVQPIPIPSTDAEFSADLLTDPSESSTT